MQSQAQLAPLVLSSPSIIQLNDFGKGVANTGVPGNINILPALSTVYAICIGSDSELDKCYIIGPNIDLQQGGLEAGRENLTSPVIPSAVPARTVHFVSVDSPFVGQWTGPLIASPAYNYGFGNGLDASGTVHGRAKLTLAVYTQPLTVLPPLKRAPIRYGWFNEASQSVLVPTMGRKLMRVWYQSNDLSNPSDLLLTYGLCTPQAGDEWSFAATTTLHSTALGTSGNGASLVSNNCPDWLLLQSDSIASNCIIELYD